MKVPFHRKTSRACPSPWFGAIVALWMGWLHLPTDAIAAPRIYRDRVVPHWFANNDQFWYKVSTGSNSHEFVLVDATKGERRPAFDHGKLAQALLAAGVQDIRPEALAIEPLEFAADGSWVKFRSDTNAWSCDLPGYALTTVPTDTLPMTSLRGSSAARSSSRTGEETSLTFLNRSKGEVELFWMDTEGQRRSYGRIGAGGTRVQHTFAGHVWLVADASGKSLGVFEAEEQASTAEVKEGGVQEVRQPEPRRRRSRGALASPDGKWRVEITNYNAVLREVDGDAAKALSSDGTEDNPYTGEVYWSPDSTKLVVVRKTKGQQRKVNVVESSPKDQVQPKLHTFEYLKPGDDVPVSKPHLFEVQSGSELKVEDALFKNPYEITQFRWAPDSSRFTFVYNERGHQVLRVLSVDATNGAITAIVDERSGTFISYSGKMFLEFLDDTRELIWMSERDGWNHLYLVDATTGQLKNPITRGEWVVRGVERVDKEARQVWFRAGGVRPGQDPYFVHLCRVNLDGSGMTILTDGAGTHAPKLSPDYRFVIDHWSTVEQAPTIELRDAKDGKLICPLERADTSELKAAAWKSPQPFVAKGRDGETDIYGIIHWPKDFDTAKKYPVIESIYAGPHDSFVPKGFSVSYGVDRLKEKGFIVVQIDGMGTSNRSKKFHDVCWKNVADAGLPDRVLWLKAAAQKYPALDLGRVGIYGTSAGGQSALSALLTQPEMYKAAVADCGCHDNRMDKIWWNEQWMGWPVSDHYAQQSNVTMAHKLQGKLLLMVGEMDRNVDPASTMQVVNALIRADKDFEMLVVPGAGHGVLGLPYCQRRMMDFFTRHLQ